MSGALSTPNESVETIPLQPASPNSSPPVASPIASPPLSPPSAPAATQATPATGERAAQQNSQDTAVQDAPRFERGSKPIRSQLSQHVSWQTLGCPRNTGLYTANGLDDGDGESSLKVNVKRIHILAAEDDPAALFTVVAFRPPLGPPVYTLGHRVA